MADIIDFNARKSERVEPRHLFSIDVFEDDVRGVWARTHDYDAVPTAEDYAMFAAKLRRLAWLAAGQAASMGHEDGAPGAAITIFTSSRVSTIWNDDLIQSQRHMDWARDQIQLGVDEIEKDAVS